MSKTNEDITRELRRLDPVGPGELDGATRTAASDQLLAGIIASDPGADGASVGTLSERRRLRPVLVLAPLAAAAAIALLLFVVLGSGGGGDDEGLASALDQASGAASARAETAADLPYAYLKTREMSVDSATAEGRSWSVYTPATREEWVAGDGSGRLRVSSGPARFADDTDRREWEAAGKPDFLPLGFDRRTEDRWLSSGTLGRGVEELSTDPVALATHLRYEAEVDPGGMPVPAATLQLIAEDLRDPGASPAIRSALFQAARRIPGIEYLGPTTDPQGRRGVAIGVAGPGGGERRLYSLIFDPTTSHVLASEVTSLDPSDGTPELVRAMSYIESRGIETMSGAGETWLSAFGSPAPWGRSPAPYVIYRVADQN